MAATISLFDLANLSIGHPGPGAVNFTALHSLLHAVLQHLGIQQVLTERQPELLGPEPSIGTEPAPSPSPYRRLEQQLLRMEQQVEELTRLPSALELLQRSRQDGKAVSDVWNLLQLRKNTELNREGVDKAMSMMEEMMQEMNYLKKFQSSVEDRIKDIDRNINSVMNQVGQVNEVLKKTEDGEQFVSWKILQRTLVDPLPEPVAHSLTNQVLAPAVDTKIASADDTQAAENPDEMATQVSLPQETESKAQAAPMIIQPSKGHPAQVHHPSAAQKGAGSSMLTVKGAEHYPDTIFALQRIRHASDYQPLLDQRVSALEKAFSELAPEASTAMDSEELKGRDESERQVPSPGEGDGDGEGAADDVRAQISNLREVVKNIDEELKDLRRVQLSGTESGAPVQQQDGGLCTELQSNIEQLQAECERLNQTTSRLIQDDQKQQSNIQSLFDSLGRLETKCGERLQMDAVTEQVNRMMESLLNKLCAHEKDWNRILQQLSAEMECKLDRIELEPLKKQLEERWRKFRKLLQTPQGTEEGAAVLRKQLISHFHCLSCDRPLDIRMPCTPNMGSLPSPNHASSGHRSQRPDADLARRRSKGERVVDLMETFPPTARSCGGSHTLTYAQYRRCPRLYEPYPTRPLDDNHSTKRVESPVMTDPQRARGRSSCKLPSIAGRDGSKYKVSCCPSQRSPAPRISSSRLPSAHLPTVLGPGSAVNERGAQQERNCQCPAELVTSPCIDSQAGPVQPRSISCPSPEPTAGTTGPAFHHEPELPAPAEPLNV
ncbi:uncharacterized protein [Hemitrygon akajei]|uniref:uncharacterized protein isoform X3 n=1 Tax=Hemitrygon akajei TaxID=2704970 RepID=UPI003BF94753